MTNILKNKLTSIIVGVVFILVGIVIVYNNKNTSSYAGRGLWPGYEIMTMEIEEQSFRLVIADNPAQWTQGLMYVRKPVKEFDGMIFRFPRKEPRTFWNQNTYVPLRLYWLADGKIVGKSELPSIEESGSIVTVNSPVSADTVIEIIQ